MTISLNLLLLKNKSDTTTNNNNKNNSLYNKKGFRMQIRFVKTGVGEEKNVWKGEGGEKLNR